MKTIIILLFAVNIAFSNDIYEDRKWGEFPNSGFGQNDESFYEKQGRNNNDFGDWKPGDGKPPWANEPITDPIIPVPFDLSNHLFIILMILASSYIYINDNNKVKK